VSLEKRNLALRVLVAVIGIPIILSLLLSGEWGVVLFAALLTILGAWEWADLCGLRRMTGLYVLGIAGPALLLAAMRFGGAEGWMLGAFLLVLLAFVFGFAGPWHEAGAVRSIGATITGIFYIGLFSLMIPISRGNASVLAADGRRLLAAALFMIWLCDTLAYFGGTAWGRHRLAPRISPKKSWEGAAFGFVGAVLGALVAWLVLRPDALGLRELLALGAVIGVVGQVGDLAESVIKRDVGVKDSSNLLPGHGGVLDRFDSFVFSLPVLFAWLKVRPWLFGT